MDNADVSFELVYICFRLYDNRNSWHNRECSKVRYSNL